MKINSFKSNTRRIENVFHLSSSIEDTLYSSPSFVVEEEQGEIIRYKRTKITFNPLHGNTSTSWVKPEIDSLNLINFCTEEEFLFTKLKRLNYDSYFISLFAENELNSVPFKDPEYDEVLITRVTAKTKENETCYYIHLNGGSLYFHRILEKDPLFWLELLRACRETNLIRVSQLHLAADCNINLMKYVTNSIKKGHYESPGLQPTAYLVYMNDVLKVRLGKNSKAYKYYIDKVFEIQTLYFGELRRQPLTIAFYDKESEQLERKDSISTSKTRIEIRLNCCVGDYIPHNLIESIVRSYYIENGNGFRIRVFLHLLTNSIRFTNHYRTQNGQDLSNWWKHSVLIPLYHVGLEIYKEDINQYLIGEKLLSYKIDKYLLPESSTKRGRGRPKGSQDSKARKPRKMNNVIEAFVIE